MSIDELLRKLVERAARPLLVDGVAEVETDHDLLVLDDHTVEPELRDPLRRFVVHPAHERPVRRDGLGQRDLAAHRVLRAVDAPDLDVRSQPLDELPSAAPGDDGDDTEPAGEPGQEVGHTLERAGLGRDQDDLGQRPVEVEEDPRGFGTLEERSQEVAGHGGQRSGHYTAAMSPRLLGFSLLLVLAAACRPDTVELSYRFPEGIRQYRMEAAATARWDIGEGGAGSYRVVFDVAEEVREEDGDAAVVEVTMTAVDVEEDGLSSPGARDLAFALRVDRNGRVLEVLEVDGVDATQLSQEEVAFIGTYRPSLPTQPVALGDVWTSEPVDAEDVPQLVTTGELKSLYEDAEGPVAELSYSGEGPLERTMDLPQGSANLTGEAATRAAASFDLEDGALRSATSSLEGTFRIRVTPAAAGATPVTGTLSLDLELEVSSRE